MNRGTTILIMHVPASAVMSIFIRTDCQCKEYASPAADAEIIRSSRTLMFTRSVHVVPFSFTFLRTGF